MNPLQCFHLLLSLATTLVFLVSPTHAIETAGDVFVNLDAASYTTGDEFWMNSGTYANFQAIDGPVAGTIGNPSGQTPAIFFNGATQAFVGGTLDDPEPAPEGLVGFDPTRSIEVWALNPAIANEETLVSWGKRGGPDGTNMAFNYGDHGNFGAVGHWGGCCPDVGWIDNDFTFGAPERNEWHHLVYTFDEETTRVYSDGVLWNEEDMVQWGGLNTFDDTAIAIASQWEADGVTLTPGLKGSLAISRVRIHDGVLTDAQIAANFDEEKGDFFNPPPVGAEPLTAGPINRYSFSEPATGDAIDVQIMDSVGGAHGVVLGDGSSLTGTELQLDGGPSDVAAYVDLPNGLISSLTDVTFESWVTIENAQGWSRIFDFGSNSPGGDDGELEGPGDDNGGDTEGRDYIFLSAERGTDTNVHRVEIRDEDPAGGGITTIDFSDPKDLPAEGYHYAVVYDADDDGNSAAVKVYRNGEFMSEGSTGIELSDINDVNNWLGRSNWTNDANFEGSFDEFRLYDYALSEGQVIGNFAAGPDVVNLGSNPGDLNGDGVCDDQDIDLLSQAIRDGDTNAKFDLNGDGSVTSDDHTFMIKDENLKNTWFGDADLNGEFGSGDLVQVFTNGKYENGQAAGWADGDFNGDGMFGSGDLVAAFTDGGYELGPKMAHAAVPEPTGVVLMLLATYGVLSLRRRRR